MLEKELLNYITLKRMIGYIFWGSQFDNIGMLFRMDHSFEQNFYNMECLKKLFSLLSGGLEVKVFDESKILTIKKLMNFYLQKHHEESNEVTNMCAIILKQADDQKGKSNDIFYKEQYEIRKCKKCFTVTKEIRKEIDESLVADIDTLNRLIEMRKNYNVELNLNNEKVSSAIAVFLYECPDMFYIREICDSLIMNLDNMDAKSENETIDKLGDFIAKNLLYIRNYQSNLEEAAYNQTFMSLIFRNDLSAVISMMSDEEIENVVNEDLLNTIEMSLGENEKTCMFRDIQLDNVLTFVNLLYRRGIIDNPTLNKFKIKINRFIDQSRNDNEYINKNRKYYGQLYKLYMGSSLNLNSKDKATENKTKHGLDALMVETGKVLSEIIDFVLPEKFVCWNSDLLFHMNYIMSKYPMLLENEIYSDRLRMILHEYYTIVDETKFNITERQQQAYDKVKKKVQKTLR